MNHRERILAAFRHEEGGGLPIDFAGTDCSSVHVTTYDALCERLGLAPRPIRLGCMTQQIVEPDTQVQDRFGADAAALFFHPRRWRRWESPYGMPVLVPDRWRPELLENGDLVVRDAAGVVRSRKPAQSYYFDPANPPLADVAEPKQLERYDALFERWDWPAVLDESVEEYGLRARALHQGGDRAVVALWRMHFLQAGQIMRGYEQFLLDMLMNESLARAILEKLLDVYRERARQLLAVAKDSIDVIFLTDDLGTQGGPMIDPEVFRRLLKPVMADLVGFIKKESGKPILLHSCGSVRRFIPDLIQIGIDALNPVQISARGMDPAELKREFGKDIVFWGGGCDTQKVLNGSTPAQVRDAVRRSIEAFAPGGGYVFTQVHNIQAQVPVENILAMYETALEYR